MNQCNQYGVPIHACNGYKHDEHVWARLTHMRINRLHPPHMMAMLDRALGVRA